MSDGQIEIAKTQQEMAKFAANWNAKVQPRLASNPTVPAQFILDLQDILTKQLGTPWFELTKVQATAKVTSLAFRIAGIGVGGGVEIPAQATDLVAQIAETAASVLTFDLANIIGPLAVEAQAQINAHGRGATVEIVTSGSDRLDQVVLTAYQAAINGWQQLATIEDLTSTNLLFRLAQAELESAIAIGRALEELIRIIVAAGRAIYESVVGIGRFIKFAAVAAIAVGGTYVAYEFFKPSQQKQPTQNPARRRRRRARGRPYGYLR